MISEDQDITGVNNASTRNPSSEYIRKMSSIASNFTNPKSVSLKAEFSKQIGDLASPQDDPVYLELYGKFHDTILYDNETRASQKLFRVRAVQFVQSYTSTRLSCWEATCEPIYRDAATVPHALMVEGSSVIETNALVGYALAEYADGIDGWSTNLPAMVRKLYQPFSQRHCPYVRASTSPGLAILGRHDGLTLPRPKWLCQGFAIQLKNVTTA